MVKEDEGRMTKGEGRSSLVIRRYLLSPVSFREYIPRGGMFANGNLYALVCSEAIHRHEWRNYEPSFCENSIPRGGMRVDRNLQATQACLYVKVWQVSE